MCPDPELEPTRTQPDKKPWFQRWWAVLGVGLLLWSVVFAVVTANNGAGGQNITGSVRCANPANGMVSGVFIEAKTLPRFWSGGPEIQSGFADWKFRGATDIADFNFWLPFGGDYSVHFGCGSPFPGEWGSDNRTPVMSGSGHFWQCNNPKQTGTTVVAADCTGN